MTTQTYSPNVKQSLAIKLATCNQKYNVKIAANPGTGKTATLAPIAKTLADNGYSVLALAFTNANVNDLEHKINDRRVDVMTCHKIGLKQFPYNKSRKIDKDRILGMLRRDKIEYKYHNSVIRLISLLKANNQLSATIQQVETIDNKYSVTIGNDKLKSDDLSAIYGIVTNYVQSYDTQNIDLDDMITLPAMGIVPIRIKYDYVLVDEYQDFNLSQVKIAQMIAKNGLIVFGQKEQSIYGFRGASNFVDLPDQKVVNLTETYRIPEVGANWLNNIFSTGIVSHKQGGNVNTDGQLSDVDNATAKDMIIARTNGELLLIALQFIATGKQFQITNKGMLYGLQAMLYHGLYSVECPTCGQKMTAKNGKYGMYFNCQGNAENNTKHVNVNLSERKANAKRNDIATAKDIISAFYDARLETAETENKIEIETEKTAVLTLLDYPEPLAMLEQIIASNYGVTLTTNHKAKGLEADHVYVITTKYFNKYVITDYQLQQEYNLLFVAYSRFKEQLTIIGDSFIDRLIAIRNEIINRQ